MGKYQDFKVDLSNQESTHTVLVNLVGKDKKVLDVGCAEGYLSKVLKESYNCEVTGIDIDEASIKEASKYCKEAHVVNLDKDDINTKFKKDQFDVALIADVLEHLSDPKSALRSILSVVKESVVISVPNLAHEAVLYELFEGNFKYRDLGLLDSTHIHFFTLDTLLELVDECDLIVDYIKPIRISAENTEFQTDTSKFPPKLREYLDSLPHTKDYQYVIKCSKKSLGSTGIVKEYLKIKEELEGATTDSEHKSAVIESLKSEKETLIEDLKQKEEDIQSLKVTAQELENKAKQERERNIWYDRRLQESLSYLYANKEDNDELHKLTEEIIALRQKEDRFNAMSSNYEKLQEVNRNLDWLKIETLPKPLRVVTRGIIALGNGGPLEVIRASKVSRQSKKEFSPVPIWPRVAILSLSYNSKQHIPAYLEAIKKIDYPKEKLEVYLLDNASADGSYETIADSISGATDIPFNIFLDRSDVNTGFSGGNNILIDKIIKDDSYDYVFLLNIDSEIHSSCIKSLVSNVRQDPAIAMAEAKQEPKEHPKYYDPINGDTGWCSGGGVLIKVEALKEVGGFDHRFFLYCEDVDLSWRMWLAGWKCKFFPEATYSHYTEDLTENKDHSVQRFYSTRNGFYMRFKYAPLSEIKNHFARINKAIEAEKGTEGAKLLQKAKKEAILNAPKFIFDRFKIKLKPRTPWIIFNEFDYEIRREFEDTEDGRRVIRG